MKKRTIFILIAGVILVAGYLLYNQYRQLSEDQNALENLEMVAVQLGDLSATIEATGVVRANQSATLSWQTSGEVGSVDIAAGRWVAAGQVLAELEQTSLSQSLILAQADLYDAQTALDDLLNSKARGAQALLAVENTEQALEDGLDAELTQAQALEAIAAAEKVVQDAGRNLRNLNSTAGQADIDAAQAQLVLVKNTLDEAEEKYAPYASKPEDNLTRANLLSQLAAAQQSYDAAARELNALLGTGSATDISIAEAEQATAEAQLAEARKDYERVQSGASNGEISLLEAELEDAHREWERLKDGPDPEEIAAAQAQVAAAKAIGSRELGRRVEVQGTDEVKAVAHAFNEMAADLERAEAQRSNLLNDVAHELRTPIAVIQGSLRAIIDDVYEMDKTEIIRLYDQTRHLSRLVDDLRQLAQAEANQLPMNIVSVDLAALIQDVASIFIPTIEAENLKLQLQLEEDVPLIKGDRSRLSQCVQNLLINAIHHTPSGGEISIKLIKDGTDVHIEVIDTGRGIPEEHLPYIFDRFYRADPARDRETGGTGLGLAITRSFIQAHHGEIWAASQGSGKGSTFHVRLPILSGAPVAEME